MKLVIKICLIINLLKTYITEFVQKKRLLESTFSLGTTLAPAVDYLIDIKFADSTSSYAFIHAKLKNGDERLIVFNFVLENSICSKLTSASGIENVLVYGTNYYIFFKNNKDVTIFNGASCIDTYTLPNFPQNTNILVKLSNLPNSFYCVYLQTNIIYKFEVGTNNKISSYSLIDIFKIERKIISYIVTKDSLSDKIYFLTNSDSNSNLATVSITQTNQGLSYQIVKEGCCDPPINLLSKYTLTLSISLNQLVLFTHNSISTESSIYYFDLSTLSIADTVINNDKLLNFSGYLIQTLKFPFDNDFFYYYITYNSNQYIGSGYFGSNSKLLQLIRTTAANVFFSVSGNRIIYSNIDRSIIKSDCPFVLTTSQSCEVKSCQSLGPNYAIRILTDQNNCQECKLPDYIFGDMCLSKCPSKYGTDEISNSCFLCKSKKLFYLETSAKCLSMCPSLYGADKNNICTLCKSVGKVFYNNTCQDKCPIGYSSDPTSAECISCTSKGQVYLPDGTCSSNCGNYMLVDNNGICYKCSDSGKFQMNNNTCVSDCPSYGILDKINNYCTDCSLTALPILSKYLQKCDDKCPYCSSDDNGRKVCDFCNICQKNNTFINDTDNSSCLNSCPEGYIQSQDSRCIYCKNKGKFYFNKTCIDSCPPKYMVDDMGICYYCEYIYENICMDKQVNKYCPFLLGPDINTNICYMCYNRGEFYHKNKCWSSCPSGSSPDDNKILCVPNMIPISDSCKNGIFDSISKKCVCKEGFIGKYCDMIQQITKNEEGEYLKITPRPSENTLIYFDKVNSFKYQFFGKSKPYNYSLLWTVNSTKNEDVYLTGRNEEILKLNTFTLIRDIPNKITLSLIDNLTNKTYIGELVINITAGSKFTCQVINTSGGENFYKNKGISKKDLICIHISNQEEQKNSSDSNSSSKTKNSTSENQKQYIYNYLYQNTYGINLTLTRSFIYNDYYCTDEFPVTNKIVVQIRGNDDSFNYATCNCNIARNTNLYSDRAKILGKINNLNFQSRKDNLKDLLYLFSNIDSKNLILTQNDTNAIINATQVRPNQKLDIEDITETLTIYNFVLENSYSKIDKEMKDKLNDLKNITNSLSAIIKNIKSDKTILPQETVTFYTKTLDTVFNLTYLNSNVSDKQVDNLKDLQIHHNNMKNCVLTLSDVISVNMDVNERVVIPAENFQIVIDRPSMKNEFFSVGGLDDKKKNNFSDINSYDAKNEVKKVPCNENSLMCIQDENFRNSKILHNLTNISSGFENLSINVVQFTSTNSIKRNETSYPVSSSTISVRVVDVGKSNENENTDLMRTFNFDTQLNIISSDVNVTQGSSCISIYGLNQMAPNCSTYFNYTSNKMICSCSMSGEYGGVFDLAITNLGKVLQFPEFQPELCNLYLIKVNELSLSLILGSLSILISFSIFLNIYDYFEDRNQYNMNSVDDHTQMSNEVKGLIFLMKAGIFKFAMFLTMYIYPFFGIISIYTYDQPRFLRFWNELLRILLSLIFSLLPYYFTKENTYRSIFIDKRDIVYKDQDSYNLPSRAKDLIGTIIYSVSASIINIVILTFLSKCMKWDYLTLKIWEDKQKKIKNYINEYEIKPVLSNSWKRLEMKCLAYYKLCGQYMMNKDFLKKKVKNIPDSYDLTILENDNNLSLRKGNKKITKELLLGTDKLYKTDQINSSILYELPDIINNESDENIVDPKILYITKEVFLSLNTNKIENDEYIKSKYKLRLDVNLKVDSKRKILDHNKMRNLKKYPKNILKFRKIESLFIKKIRKNQIKENMYFEAKISMIKQIIAIIFFVLLFGFIYYSFVFIIYKVYKTFGFYIIKVWLAPALIQLVIVDFIVVLTMNIITSVLLFKFYYQKDSNLICRLMYMIFVSEESMMIYTIRNFITKHTDFLLKNKNIGI